MLLSRSLQSSSSSSQPAPFMRTQLDESSFGPLHYTSPSSSALSPLWWFTYACPIAGWLGKAHLKVKWTKVSKGPVSMTSNHQRATTQHVVPETERYVQPEASIPRLSSTFTFTSIIDPSIIILVVTPLTPRIDSSHSFIQSLFNPHHRYIYRDRQ